MRLMENARLVLACMAVGCLMSILATDASAQNRNRTRSRYQSPSGSPISPAMEFFRFPSGIPGLNDNYNAFVRPRAQLNRRIEAQNRELRQTEESLNTLNNQFQRQLPALGRAVIGPTGKSAGFMNYSHFYPMRPRSLSR